MVPFKTQLFYLHGFNSGFDPKNQKIKELKKLADVVTGRTTNYLHKLDVVELESTIKSAVEGFDGETILVGTSLGGYFARYFSKELGLRCIIINPSVDPSMSLARAIGEQTNYLTGQTYEVTKAQVEQLASYSVSVTEDCLMILCTDDDVIDYKKPLKRYGQGAKVVITTGGHRLESLNTVSDDIQTFINMMPTNDYPL